MEHSIPERFFRTRAMERSCETLIGICSGLLADTKLNEMEVRFLDLWLADNTEIASCWPGSVISNRISEILSDGVVSEEELESLKEILSSFIGGGLEQTGSASSTPTRLPLDSDIAVTFESRSFCFTGKFLFGTRTKCHEASTNRGALVTEAITQDLAYLVIGTIVSPAWIHSAFGRKIEKAAAFRDRGCGLRIISEENWVASL